MDGNPPTEMNKPTSSLNNYRCLLSAAALLQALAGIAFWLCYHKTGPLPWPEWIFIFGGVFYSASRYAPDGSARLVIPLDFGLSLVLLVYVLEWNPRQGNIFYDGRLLGAIVAFILLWASLREIKAEQVRKRLPPLVAKELAVQCLLLLLVVASSERLIASNHDIAVIAH